MWLVVTLYPFLIVYCSDKYKFQKLCDEGVNDCLAVLNIYSWLVCYKLNYYKTLYCFVCRCCLLFFYEDSDNVPLCCNEMGILSVNLHNINLDNFDEGDPDTIILIRHLAGHSKFKKH